VVRRRGRFCHEAIEGLPQYTFRGRDPRELTTEGTEEHGGSQSFHSFDCAQDRHVARNATRMGHREISERPEIGNPNLGAEDSVPELSWEEERERRIYRGRTVTMLRRYMRYSIETGRVPSLLGREFFQTRVTSYTVVTFEDRVIFVHDMETCLNRLDEFSRQLIARHILQEHDQAATARLLHCAERTVRSYVCGVTFRLHWMC
jgi:DNA-directed RNA polymerase specialized sigma24 family protein